MAPPQFCTTPFFCHSLSSTLLIGFIVVLQCYQEECRHHPILIVHLINLTRSNVLSSSIVKKINDELRWLRVELTSIPIYHPKCAVISLQIENLKLKKKKYNDTLQMPSYSLVAKPVPIPKHFPPVSSANTSHLKSLDSTLH